MSNSSAIFVLIFFMSMLLHLVSPVNRTVGILYSIWHCEAATAMAQVKSQGHPQLTTESVIRSDGSLTLDDVYPVVSGPYASKDIWNTEPALGFYCLCSKRTANDTLPDCPMASTVARKHANMLVTAGFDYVAIDITNWPQVNPKTDVAVLRPLEVLFDEWLQLRKEGIKTPQIAPWCTSHMFEYPNGDEPTWKWLLDHIYNNATRAPLIWYDPYVNKMVFFIPYNSGYNATVEEMIQTNNGRNNIHTIDMWALFGESDYKKGVWGFFSPCRTKAGNKYTTSMVGPNVGECMQYETIDDNQTVEEITASGGYMLTQCALPFGSPGHMRGLTLQRLFKKVLEVGAKYLFISSFNEHIGGRQVVHSSSNTAFNMGLPNDPQRKSVWVDTYAAEFSRDIEPTVEGGSNTWEVASSCIQLYKTGMTCKNANTSLCCSTKDKLVFANAWSLESTDNVGKNFLITSSSTEKEMLINSGKFKELCNSFTGPSVFCVDTKKKDGRNGPFMLYNIPNAVEKTTQLYRCGTSTGGHFISINSACEGKGNLEATIGYLSKLRGGETLRSLRRCALDVSLDIYTHSLDLACDGEEEDVLLGFVR